MQFQAVLSHLENLRHGKSEMLVVYIINVQLGRVMLCNVNKEMKRTSNHISNENSLIYGVKSYLRRVGENRPDNLSHVN